MNDQQLHMLGNDHARRLRIFGTDAKTDGRRLLSTILLAAADEIERLEAELAKVKEETK